MFVGLPSPRLRAGATLAVLAVLTWTVSGFATSAERRVSIRFRPMVGAEPFACGRTYAGIGASKTTLTPSDFAVFVHNVRLVARDGREAAVTLDQDSLYQNGSLALLDFEDGSGPCLNGNAATHAEVTGTVPDGEYTGVRFTIGVPFERNHRDLATQPPPLSVTRMFWAWNSGHKFVRLDAKASTGRNWVLHLGSTGCTPTGGASVVPTTCAQSNRVEIALDRFDVDRDVIVADAAALFAGNGTNGDSSQVCMSSPRSGACRPMFASLGLPFNDAAASMQTFLSVAPMAPKADGR
jgi:uncharacterized repeat protein (TIGR04052 family)